MGLVLSKVSAEASEAFSFATWYTKTSAPYKISAWTAFHLLRLAIVLLRSFWWLFRGVILKRWRARRRFEDSAHVQTILMRHKMDPVLEYASEANFITAHHSFVNPLYALRDDVTLYQITEDEAIFVQTDESVDVALSDVASFMRVAQFNHAKRLITMPMKSFHIVADLIGRPKGSITFLNNTTRCGSTVLVQMFEKTGHCRAMSEPDALNAIAFLARRQPKEKVKRVFESTVRLLCKPHKGKNYENYLLKTTAPGIYATELMNEQFPDSKVLFCYRNGTKVADSLSKACIQMPVLRIGYLFFTTFPYFMDAQASFAEYACNFPDHPKLHLPIVYPLCIFTWGIIVHRYQQFYKNGRDIVAVKYEHLVQNPRENMEIILKYCGLPLSWVDDSLLALENDSQRNSPLSMKDLKRLEAYAETFDHKEHKLLVDWISGYCQLDYDAPKDFVAKGTITVAKSKPKMVEEKKTDWTNEEQIRELIKSQNIEVDREHLINEFNSEQQRPE